MRYDIEIVVSGALVALLGDLMDESIACLPGEAQTAPCLIVGFNDPMSIDDANRITVMVPTAETNVEDASQFLARVEVVAKSQWTKATLKKDYDAHNARVTELRDKLSATDLADRMAAKMPAGSSLEFVSPKRSYSTKVYDNGWIVSEAAFNLNGHFPPDA